MSDELDESLELGEPDKIGENIFVVNLRVKALESERDKQVAWGKELAAEIARLEAAEYLAGFADGPLAAIEAWRESKGEKSIGTEEN